MPTYINTSEIASGNPITAASVRNALEALDGEIASINAARKQISTGASDQGKIVCLNQNGLIDSSMLPGTDWDAWETVRAAENAIFSDDGIVFGYETEFSISLWSDAMKVTVTKGAAQLNGYRFMPTADATLDIPTPDSTYNRIDDICLRRNTTTNVIERVIKQGTPSADPQPPTLDSNELELYTLLVPPTAATGSDCTATDKRRRNIKNQLVPIGTILPFAGTVAPYGFLLCDGSAVSRTAYAALFQAIGTTVGAGNGSTTLNVPDLRGRFLLGLDNLGGTSANRVTASEADTLGGASGSETHTLTVNEMPSHFHGIKTGDSSQASITPDDTNYNKFQRGVAGMNMYARNNAANTWTTNSGILNTGGSSPHNNMPPYLAIGFIIKY